MTETKKAFTPYKGDLFNEKVRSLDPYNKDLKSEEKDLILAECKVNAFYFTWTIVINPENKLAAKKKAVATAKTVATKKKPAAKKKTS